MTRHNTTGARIFASMLVRVHVGLRAYATLCPFAEEPVITSGHRHTPSTDWIPRVDWRLWQPSLTSSGLEIVRRELRA